jgi:polygalacturonase
MKKSAILLAMLVLLPCFANAKGTTKPAKRYPVTDFGAVADGTTVNTKAIQAAIDKCASSGGGVIVHNQAVWCLFILYSEDVVAENLRITADHNIPSSDGIDIDSSRRVRVNNVDIDVNDDCISIKSGKDADGLRVNRPAEDIVIENSRFHYGHGGVAMGSETSGGIRNVEVRNCVSDSGNWAPIRFKTQPSRGGVVENITYRDMQLKDTKQAFEFNMEWRMVPPIAPPAKVLPKITAQKGFKIDHARNVDMKGLLLDVKEGEAITKTDVE